MKNNIPGFTGGKSNESEKTLGSKSLKNDATKAASILLVSAVFLVAIIFLIYNSANAITVLSENATVNPEPQNAELVVAQTVYRVSDIVDSYRLGRPESSIYRNGKDKNAGIRFFRFPVSGGNITGGFGMRENPFDEFGFAEFHSGLDVGAPLGTPVFAAAKGVVIFSGVDGGYGNVIIVAHDGSKVTSRYAHLSRLDVGVGSVVTTRTQLGLVGSTGRSTGPHLHFEVRVDDKAVNPLAVFNTK